MAGERKRVAGELAAWHVIEILRRFTGESLTVDELNPYSVPNPEIQEKRAESATKRFFQFAEQSLFGKQVHER